MMDILHMIIRHSLLVHVCAIGLVTHNICCLEKGSLLRIEIRERESPVLTCHPSKKEAVKFVNVHNHISYVIILPNIFMHLFYFYTISCFFAYLFLWLVAPFL